MDWKLLFTGGEPDMKANEWQLMQESNRDFLVKYITELSGGQDCIICGCEYDDSNMPATFDLSEGYVFLNGEILKCDGYINEPPGSILGNFGKQTTYDTNGDKVFKDGVFRQTIRYDRAIGVGGGGGLSMINGQRIDEITVPWTTATLKNSFTQYAPSPIRYRKNKSGQIELSGFYSDTTAVSDILLTLPIGFRPPNNIYITIGAGLVSYTGLLYTNGDIQVPVGIGIAGLTIIFPV